VPNRASNGDEDNKAPSSVSPSLENLGYARCDVMYAKMEKRKITALNELVVAADQKKKKKQHSGRRGYVVCLFLRKRSRR